MGILQIGAALVSCLSMCNRCISICLSIYLSVCLSVCLSIQFCTFIDCPMDLSTSWCVGLCPLQLSLSIGFHRPSCPVGKCGALTKQMPILQSGWATATSAGYSTRNTYRGKPSNKPRGIGIYMCLPPISL